MVSRTLTAVPLAAALHGTGGDRADAVLAALDDEGWIALADAAVRLRMGPLLWHRLVDRGWVDQVPAVAAQRLHARAQASATRALLLQSEFQRLARAMAARGVTVVALKGIHLAAAVFPSAALREMNDIDILIPREDVPTATDVLRDLAYRPDEPYEVEVVLATRHHLPRHFNGRVGLEVHWRLKLAEAAAQDANIMSDVIARAGRFPFEPGTRALSPEDLLWHLAVHGAVLHHFDQGPRPIYDAAAVIDRYGRTLDWAGLRARAAGTGSARALSLVVVLAARHAGAVVPPSVLEDLSRDVPEDVVSQALALSFTPGPDERPSASEARILSRERILVRAAHVIQRFWCPPEELAALYGAPLARVRRNVIWYRLVRFWDHARRLPRLVAVCGDADGVRPWVDRRNALATWLRDRR